MQTQTVSFLLKTYPDHELLMQAVMILSKKKDFCLKLKQLLPLLFKKKKKNKKNWRKVQLHSIS